MLLLSLLVQSVQQLIKRILRIKARQLEKALDALFKKVGLPHDSVKSMLSEVALDFERNGNVATRQSSAENISKTEVLLWFQRQQVNGDLRQLQEAVAKVNCVLTQNPTGDAAAPFASLQASIRAFLDELPADSTQFTYALAKKGCKNIHGFIRDDISELQKTTTKANQIESLPGALTVVCNEWNLLRAPANRIEQSLNDWFDTTINAFNERFDHEMKRWTLGLGFIVVICFIANFFDITRDAFGSSVRRAIILKNLDVVKELADRNCGNEKSSKACLEEKIKQSQDIASAIGLKPLDPAQFSTLVRDPRSLLGWLITTLLLSVGAPFWQDALQLLFALKNTFRKPPTSEDSKARLA